MPAATCTQLSNTSLVLATEGGKVDGLVSTAKYATPFSIAFSAADDPGAPSSHAAPAPAAASRPSRGLGAAPWHAHATPRCPTGLLNRAEWVKFLALFLNRDAAASQAFDGIKAEYEATKVRVGGGMCRGGRHGGARAVWQGGADWACTTTTTPLLPRAG